MLVSRLVKRHIFKIWRLTNLLTNISIPTYLINIKSNTLKNQQS
ncbi:hypothetical protein Slin_4872 [Spirosoma linguale DSM 74]|uniref:Uncharacterized protein n=1 Tax=Spirosoma linguale (strain ATCC 33905 / DSM 74 / LMG 10896 / Claus 1) TaxID=504472 RepID=D2QRE5_SPILD|nr:hypothetical protein Slin_4872 [Spirosoma linguale DSM 74]